MKAYITLLSTNNYLYGAIGLMYSWKATNPKYPFYCIVTKDILPENIAILEAVGYKIIVEDLYIPHSYLKTLQEYETTGNFQVAVGNSTADLQKNGWQYAWTKLKAFSYTQFEKLLYIDVDSYILQNLDSVFDSPGWSSVCEWDSPWTRIFRFHTAFLLIEPNEQVYQELLQLAEDNPIIKHPVTEQLQLSNDYDLLNLYKQDWAEHLEYRLPNYTYLDSYALATTDALLPFILNTGIKVKAIHLTGDKPWLAGTKQVQSYGGEWGLWKELYLIYSHTKKLFYQ